MLSAALFPSPTAVDTKRRNWRRLRLRRRPRGWSCNARRSRPCSRSFRGRTPSPPVRDPGRRPGSRCRHPVRNPCPSPRAAGSRRRGRPGRVRALTQWSLKPPDAPSTVFTVFTIFTIFTIAPSISRAPSSRTSWISPSSAGIAPLPSTATIVAALPSLMADAAQSMATLPPPMTTTFDPMASGRPQLDAAQEIDRVDDSGGRPCETAAGVWGCAHQRRRRRRNIPSAVGPGRPRISCAPATTSTPRSTILAVSAATTLLGRRNSGTP